MPDDPAELRIRRATPADAETLFGFVSQLARYEKLAHEVVGSAGEMREQLASDRPPFEALLAELDTGPLGFALYFETYSTFHTARCLHLEDLFVTPEARGRGVGRALLAAVARAARDRECPRLQWNVLDWNAPAIGFYERVGAEVLADWRTCRVAGDVIAKLANDSSSG
ncbi:MAG: GNAT family N-acetyltransferase [Planctomycetes bacterium]|nr:GNAT family N-acetyltransferase [Planctomycetota bacterium]